MASSSPYNVNIKILFLAYVNTMQDVYDMNDIYPPAGWLLGLYACQRYFHIIVVRENRINRMHWCIRLL